MSENIMPDEMGFRKEEKGGLIGSCGFENKLGGGMLIVNQCSK